MPRNDSRYVIAAVSLGLVAILGTIAILAYGSTGKDPPNVVVAIAAYALNALVGELGERSAEHKHRSDQQRKLPSDGLSLPSGRE